MWDPGKYNVGWICALESELVAARVFLDTVHPDPESVAVGDENAYALGAMGKHNVVIASLPEGYTGHSPALSVAKDMTRTFPNVRIGLLVGVGGGAPRPGKDIRLGDVVVSTPYKEKGGVIQYDMGKEIQGQPFQMKGHLDKPPTVLLTAVRKLRSEYAMDSHQLDQAINGILERKPKLRRNYARPDPDDDRLYQAGTTHPIDNSDDCTIACKHSFSSLISRPQREDWQDNPAIHSA
jgi:nucleoside phosphorylase